MLAFLLLALIDVVSAWLSPSSHLAHHEALSTRDVCKRAGDKFPGPPPAPALSKRLSKRADSGTTRLGDYFDLSYTVMVKVGEVEMPLIVDTGSSDLSVLADDCLECNSTGLALYPKSSLVPTPYSIGGGGGGGDYMYTSGPIGIETVELAGVSMSDQYFLALNHTGSMIGISSSGIIGFGFPAFSSVWGEGYSQTVDETCPIGKNGRFKAFTYATFAPLLTRMAMTKTIKYPMFSLSFQRVSIDLTATNPGILSIGDLPAGVQNETLVWKDTRRYTDFDITGVEPSEDELPFEEWPICWEIFIEDVYFDGVKLLTPDEAQAVKNSASIESTSSWIEGPPTVLQEIRDLLHGDWFDCSIPHTLTFQIGGKMFPVDPRDFIFPMEANSTKICRSILLSTVGLPVTVEEGPRYSWILGTPFLKGVFASFYYGNLTHPWLDPPRVGLLSKVPGNAGELLKEAVKKGVFANTTEELFASSSTSVGTSTTSASTPTSPVRTGESIRLGCWWAWWCGALLVTFLISFVPI